MISVYSTLTWCDYLWFVTYRASEKQIVSATQEVSNDAVKESLSWSKNNVSTALSDRRCYVLYPFPCFLLLCQHFTYSQT